MNLCSNTELDSSRPFLETIESANLREQIDAFIEPNIDRSSHNVSDAIPFEGEQANEWCYHLEQKHASADI
ncbi:hypothetical protein OGM63_00120 [Plectonema radiosum NIES-515]|uniref:Acyl-CoA dehydrogenase n=1 Tax=Plectonema radiosum NIES-515 TaxID=2986073 RepID=A0ABT3ASB2_9CYAN|nr:hypothetical protein [Plectonema radiosum]MCV3211945.1 hypothetical protein [Plectonema radiosum NIES-515]